MKLNPEYRPAAYGRAIKIAERLTGLNVAALIHHAGWEPIRRALLEGIGAVARTEISGPSGRVSFVFDRDLGTLAATRPAKPGEAASQPEVCELCPPDDSRELALVPYGYARHALVASEDVPEQIALRRWPFEATPVSPDEVAAIVGDATLPEHVALRQLLSHGYASAQFDERAHGSSIPPSYREVCLESGTLAIAPGEIQGPNTSPHFTLAWVSRAKPKIEA